MEENTPKIHLLTDDIIVTYSENNILTEYQDINLKVTTKVEPYPNGVYDQDIFGSLFLDRCNCGNMRSPGIRCPRCGSMVLDEVSSFRRFARIESPVYYVTKYKFKKLIKLIKENFRVVKKFSTGLFGDLNWTDQKVMDICQWNYNEDEDYLQVTDEITDFTKCSYEGLIYIMQKYNPELLPQIRAYLNQYILVAPMAIRAPRYRVIDGRRQLDNHEITVIYQNIIYCIHNYYKDTFPTMKDELGKAIFRGALRRLISTSLDGLSQLMKASKANMARYMQSNRLPNSGRCVIVPDPTLAADEVVIPRHLMYETCRDEFIQYISDKKNVSLKEAELIYKTQAEYDEVQKLFDDYINGDGTPNSGKYVVINRAPTLHELSMFTCKVRLTHDYAMKIPLVLCSPMNGDFDGDTLAYYAIPKKLNTLMNEALSAKSRFLYKKSHKPIYTPKGDMMHGLTLATKVEFVTKPETFDSLEDAIEHKRKTKGFKYQTLIVLNGKKTTIAREILSKHFDKDVNAYLGGLDKTLNSKNMIVLYEQLKDKEDRLERIRDIQQFALNVVTISGSTATKLSEMYLDIDKKYLDRIKAIEKDDNIDQKAKEIMIRDIYKDFQKEHLSKIPEGLRQVIDETGRAKSTELRDMAIQQLKVGPDHQFHVTETTLVQGLSPEDYEWHAIENRATQDIKQGAVPQSGYVTRQFIYLASEYYYIDELDEENDGILMSMKRAEGRTTLKGDIIGKSSSDELVKVRSIITSHKGSGIITRDMLPSMFKYKHGSRIGMSLISSLTEQLTQGGLKLKHGGDLYNLDPNDRIKAPENGRLEVLGNHLIFHGDSKSDYLYPKSSMFIQNYSPNDRYKKGEPFAVNYHAVTPSYALDCIIKLCLARSTNNDKSFANNKKLVSECYAINDGVVKYDTEGEYIRVYVGDVEYTYNPDCLYFLPEGTPVKKFDRICTGVLDMKSMVYKVTDYIELYYYFRKQFLELISEVSDEMIEFVYTLLTKKHEDSIEINSVLKNIHGSESFFKSLAFGHAAKSFEKIGYEGMDFVADPITQVILSLVVSNQIK